MNNDEIQHWGVKGMRWGFRRYQNKDGSLTPLGKKRAAKLAEEYERTTGRKIRTSKPTAEKSMKDMTTKQLQKETDRMNAEQRYMDAQRNRINAERALASMTPQKVSKGKAFTDALMKDVVVPAAKNAGRQWMENKMKDVLGLNVKEAKDPIQKLKDEKTKLELKKDIDKLKHPNKHKDDEEELYNEMQKLNNRYKTLKKYEQNMEEIKGKQPKSKVEDDDEDDDDDYTEKKKKKKKD